LTLKKDLFNIRFKKINNQIENPAQYNEIKKNIDFYFAEIYHQQYLYKNPNGYCGLGGCGVKFK